MKKLFFTAIYAMAFTTGFANDNDDKSDYCGYLAITYAGGKTWEEFYLSMGDIYNDCMKSTPLPEMTIDKPKDNTLSEK